MKAQRCAYAVLGALLSTAAAGSPAADAMLYSCIEAARLARPGDITKLEVLEAAGRRVYEIEVRDAAGAEWELMCDGQDGAIFETESEAASEDAPEFEKSARISEQQAIAAALKARPGEVVEIEYEIESDGAATFEIDIVGADGGETKIEIDAATGEVIETWQERWQIGAEAGESR